MSDGQEFQDLSERAQALLKTLVEQYIHEGHPIGSRTLLERSGLSASSATVRNVMSRLEKMGFIRAPHTSAGRIPTNLGYRCFVDTLLRVEPLQEGQIARLKKDFDTETREAMSSMDMVKTASTMLSGLTRLAGVVTVPHPEHAALNRIEFVPLSERKVLVILVVNREVENRVVELDRAFSESELRQASNYLNEKFAGSDIAAVRRRIVRELEKTRGDMDQLMADAILLAKNALEKESSHDDDIVVAGETHLMECEELSDMERLRALFEAFSEQRDLLHLLDQSLSAQGVKIFIGEESGYELLEACSVVTAPYSNDEGVVGVLAVIGPTRMAYERVIPIVDITSKFLSSALKS
ncbi:MAG: heat-inducible transcription repressor HrcA [Gammaproteobacteria bacterium]|nr:heat-inducible transcription repressor HrcA [Gammaproteobacteria bacterium]